MFKITAVVCLMLIVTTIWAARMSCDSCGSECVSACGTRRFRTCCFNYLRRKREPDTVKFVTPYSHDNTLESASKPRLPIFIVENIPEQWFSNVMAYDFETNPLEDNVEN